MKEANLNQIPLEKPRGDCDLRGIPPRVIVYAEYEGKLVVISQNKRGERVMLNYFGGLCLTLLNDGQQEANSGAS